MNPSRHVLKLIVLLCLALPIVANAQTTAEEYCDSGRVKRLKGDLDGAIGDFNHAIELDKNSGFAHLLRGCVYFMQHNWAKAMADYRKCCELHLQQSDYPHLFIWLIRVRLGEKEAADKELSAYLEKRGNTPAGDWPVKVASFLLGRMSENDLVAAAVSPNAREDRGQRCEAWFYAGMKRLLVGDKTAAADCFRRSLATEAKTWTEYHFAQVELKALGQSGPVAGAPPGKEQLRLLAKLPTIDLKFYYGFDSIAGAASKRKTSPAALAAEIAAAKKAQEAHAGDATCYVRLGDLYGEAKNTNAATRAYAKACGLFHRQLESQPNDADLWTGYGKALKGADRPDEGEAALRKAVKLAPQNATAWTELGESLATHALRLVRPWPDYHDEYPFQKTIDAVTQHPPTSEARVNAQRLFTEAGDCFDKAVAAAPQSAAPYMQRYAYRTMRRMMFRTILEKQPVSPLIILDPDALPDLRKAAQLNTEDYHAQYCCALFEFFSEVIRQKLDIENQQCVWPKLSDGTRQSINDTMARLTALTTAPDNTKASDALEALGILQFFVRRDDTHAIATLRRAVTLDPTREQAWDMLMGVLVLHDAKRTNDLVAVCQQRLDARKSVRNHLLMANVWDMQDRPKEVETHVRAAIKLQPKDALANLAQAALSVRCARDAASLNLASQHIAATAKLFTDATPREQQADLVVLQSIHAALSGQLDKANEHLDHALRIDPNNAHVKDLLRALRPSGHPSEGRRAATVAVAEPSGSSAIKVADLRTKAGKGDAQSQLELGHAFFYGNLGLVKDEVEAVKWYRKAAEQNQAVAQYGLGRSYIYGQGVAKDEVEAVKWWRKAAEQNQADAQYSLGRSYIYGQGVAKDEVEAVKWWRKAAEQNQADAQYSLGLCYDRGQGVTKNDAEAVKWYRKAAEQNQVDAQYNLGWCYTNGQGVTKDDAEAVKWYRKAAEQNHAAAQYGLGRSYIYGQGLAKDEVEAVKWCRKAAEQNQAAAQYSLGLCYGRGQGVTKDDAEAVKWYRKAAEQNQADAQYSLGSCYSKGKGVQKDAVEGYRWLLLAARQGVETAKKAVTALEGSLTTTQIEAGKRRADDWTEQYKLKTR